MANADGEAADPADSVEELPRESALFELLGSEDRLRIVRELATADAGPPVAFSTLRERVGVEDSGRFNYHLGRLQGSLVRKREDGYELTGAGRAVADSLALREVALAGDGRD